MQSEIISLLLDLNRQFYQTFARSFADTRRRIQPGVRRVLSSLPSSGRWLDLGCGSGAFAAELVASGRTGLYLGMDFSPGLLDEAGRTVDSVPHPGLEIRFLPADLSSPDWAAPLAGQTFDQALAFAVLHHLPYRELRLRVLRLVSELLVPGGLFVHSEWQFQNSPRLLARRLSWQTINIPESELEEGDTLLDWRHPQPGQPGKTGLRYVHRFDEEELDALAAESGFTVRETFLSDGENDRLGLYQVWQKTAA